MVKLSHHYLLFVRGLRPFHLRFVWPRQIDLVQDQLVSRVRQRNILATGKDLVTAMLVVPLRDGGVLMHMLDDVPPADASVVGTKTNFTFLGSVRNDAHLRPPEIVIESILEPHPSDETKIPTIR